MESRVLAVMLANGRQAMVERAIRSFRQQTYTAKHLAILDTGQEPLRAPIGDGISLTRMPLEQPKPIGALRNLANLLACSGVLDAPLIAHWDSDDWSHAERLSEQVAFLGRMSADCVGYREMLFWKTPTGDPSEVIRCECGNTYTRHMLTVCPKCSAWPDKHRGEAWTFRSPNPAYCIGTSLLYTRKIWERFPFPEKQTGEDTIWLHEKRIKRAAINSGSLEGSMIASIHGGNTSSAIEPGAREWRRAPAFDDYCRKTMQL